MSNENKTAEDGTTSFEYIRFNVKLKRKGVFKWMEDKGFLKKKSEGFELRSVNGKLDDGYLQSCDGNFYLVDISKKTEVYNFSKNPTRIS